MTSWRDTASELTQDDLDQLLEVVLPFAEQTYEQYGELFPFAATIDLGGELSMLMADPQESPQAPSAEQALTGLYRTVADAVDGVRATAFVCDVSIEGSDAVRVELEHAQGVALAVFLPYTTTGAGAEVEFGELFAGVGERRIWPSD